jgi:hypothetical protein
MTFDIVALCRARPDPAVMIAALEAAGPQLRVQAGAEVVQLCDDRGIPLVSIEGPRLVQVPGEARRLLGVDVESPVWWVETHARGGDADAEALARRFTAAVVAGSGGVSWSGR